MPGTFTTISAAHGTIRPWVPAYVNKATWPRAVWAADVGIRGLLLKPKTKHINPQLDEDRASRVSPVRGGPKKSQFRNFIHLINLHRDPSGKSLVGQPLFSYITFPYIPLEIEITPETTWAPIPVVGRNNPHYHFSGSEDTMELRIDWFAQKDSLQDVILACRWVESLSKADGYNTSPPVVKLVWGETDLLFRDHEWIVAKAPYSLSQFQPNKGLMPMQAYQILNLKRVTKTNLTHNEIQNL